MVQKEKITVDSDIILQYLKTGKGPLPEAYEKYEMIISTSTYTELLASETFKDRSLENEVKEFIHKYFKIQEITLEIAQTAAEIIRKHDFTMAEAYVISTALSTKTKLLTYSQKPFTKVLDLKFVELK